MPSFALLSSTSLLSCVDATAKSAAAKKICSPAPRAAHSPARLPSRTKAISSRGSSAWSVSRPTRAQRFMICRAEGEHDQTKVAEAEEADSEEAVPEEADETTPAAMAAKFAGIENKGLRAELLETEFAALLARVEVAEVASASASAQNVTLKDQALRLSADFENFRKRTLTEKAALSDSAKFKTIESLLPVIDNFELAKGNLKVETEEALKTQAAYEQLYKQLVDIFRNLGLKVVATVGEVFDPEVHDAIMQEPTAEFEDGVVMQEFRKGFTFNGSLLRAAMVKVAQNDDATGAEVKKSADETEAADDVETSD